MADDLPVKGVYTSLSSDGNPLPLFITPKNGNDSVIFLKYWVKMNKSWLERKVLDHGRPPVTFTSIDTMVRGSRCAYTVIT